MLGTFKNIHNHFHRLSSSSLWFGAWNAPYPAEPVAQGSKIPFVPGLRAGIRNEGHMRWISPSVRSG